MKLPSMQWYPGDWRKDPGVQALTYEERGIWFELLMLMHDCEPRGKLMLHGQPISHERIGNMVRLPTEKISQVISQLISLDVAGLDAETGALISRRMVRDEEKRAKLSAFGKLGGNPAFEKGKDNPYHKPPHKPTPKPTISPSSSSSSSSSEEKKPPTPLPAPPAPSTQPDLTDAFDELWNAYPVKGRSKRVACEGYFVEILEGLRGEALERRIAAIRKPVEPGGAWHRSAKWSKGFIQGLDTYLKQRMWDEQPPSAEAEKSEVIHRYEDCDNPQSINYGMNEIGYYKGRDAK